jgi:hypothetical protein
LNLALVSSDALYQTAEAIQACLVDVLRDAFLLQAASEQQIADLHAKLDESDERAGTLQHLVYDAEAAAAHLRRRTQYLESVNEDQRVLAEDLAENNRKLRLQLAGADRPPAPTPISVRCTVQPSPPRDGSPPGPVASDGGWPGWLHRGSPVGSVRSGGPAAERLRIADADEALALHVAELNDLQLNLEPVHVAPNHSRDLSAHISDYAAPAAPEHYYVLPAAVPVGASVLGASRVELKNVDKINLGAKCLKLFTSAATSDFVPKSMQFFELFENKLRSYGLDGVIALLLTRRLRVIGDNASRSLDVSRIVNMLRAASRPYGGLNRLCPFWRIATRDLQRRPVVYVPASTLLDLDSILTQVFAAHADEQAQQRVIAKCAPSDTAYDVWLSLCNYPFSGPTFSETALRTASRNHLDTLKFDCKKCSFKHWEAEVCEYIRTHTFLFPSSEFSTAGAYVDHLWQQCGLA